MLPDKAAFSLHCHPMGVLGGTSTWHHPELPFLILNAVLPKPILIQFFLIGLTSLLEGKVHIFMKADCHPMVCPRVASVGYRAKSGMFL